MRVLLAVCLMTLMVTSDARAQERPTVGIVYHTTENSALTYNCKSSGNDVIECEFVQTFVRLQSTPEQLPGFLEKARSSYAEEVKGIKTRGCGDLERMDAILKGGQTALPAEAPFAKASAAEKDEIKRWMSLMLQFCKSPTMPNFEAFIKFQHDKDCRTCNVGSHSYTQKMRRNSTGAWTTIPIQYGPCGIVQLDRFEVAERMPSLVVWNYIARKAVTNPKATTALAPCNTLDESEYIYKWVPRDLFLPCNYIKFSIF